MAEDYTKLAEQAKLGQADAFARLYELVYKDLYRFALYTLKNRQDAEDIVGDTVADAYQQISSLRKAEAFKAWIFCILANKCKKRLEQYLAKTAELSDDYPQPDRDICEDLDVRTAFASLEDEERLILSLHIFGGYSSKEIGRVLSLNSNTVRSRQSRALKKMERYLST